MATQKFIPTEDQEQHTFVYWLEIKRLTFIHVPNGGNRNALTGARLKAQGVKAGFPDIIIFDSPPGQPDVKGIVIEMKKQIGSKTSKEQKDWIERLQQLGWIARICKGAAEAIKTMEDLGF